MEIQFPFFNSTLKMLLLSRGVLLSSDQVQNTHTYHVWIVTLHDHNTCTPNDCSASLFCLHRLRSGNQTQKMTADCINCKTVLNSNRPTLPTMQYTLNTIKLSFYSQAASLSVISLIQKFRLFNIISCCCYVSQKRLNFIFSRKL